MKYILTKLSSPGWEKEFTSEVEAKNELYKHICSSCRKGEEEFFFEPVDQNSSIFDMLCSPCGCEFYFEEIE